MYVFGNSQKGIWPDSEVSKPELFPAEADCTLENLFVFIEKNWEKFFLMIKVSWQQHGIFPMLK